MIPTPMRFCLLSATSPRLVRIQLSAKKLVLMAGSASRIPEAGAPAVRSRRATTAPPPEIPPERAPLRIRRHRIKNLPFPVGRRSGPATPLARWKLDDAAEMTPELAVLEGAAAAFFSARKLAAALWHLRAAEVGRSGGSGTRLGFEPKSRLDQLNSASAIYSLQAELEQAHICINKLENEKQCTEKKVDHITKKLAEEKASWQSKEHQKIRNIIESIKHDLSKEKKRHRRIEIINSKLVNELAEAKLSANQFLQDCEKERKAREHIEKVCEQLSKVNLSKICEELEEERRMLQMAEVWREERVQLKLVDAKITLEEKYAELNKLQADLDTFLRIHSGTTADHVSDLKEANGTLEQASVSVSSEVCSRRTTRQSRKKISSIGKLWRSSFMSKINSDRKIPDGKMLNASLSPCISRGTHELQSEMDDRSAKKKLFEARKENQRFQFL